MKYIRYLAYLFYSYYSKGARVDVPYISSILALTFLFYIQIMMFVVIFNIQDHIPIGIDDPKTMKYLKISLLLSPIFIFLYFGVKEKKLLELKEKLEYVHFEKEFNHRALLFAYLILIFLVTAIFAVINK